MRMLEKIALYLRLRSPRRVDSYQCISCDFSSPSVYKGLLHAKASDHGWHPNEPRAAAPMQLLDKGV